MKKYFKTLRAIAPGWDVYISRGNHIVLRHPCGRKVFTSLTPSDRRVLKNTRTQVRHVEREFGPAIAS